MTNSWNDGKSVKVLIVDADLKNVQMLGTALRDRGCEPLEATTFEAAKRLWIAQRPAMLIADIRLGPFNGLQLLLRARNDRPDVTAVITSAVPDLVLEAETQRFGGTFLVKPVDPERVIAAMFGAQLPQKLARFEERRTGERRSNPMTVLNADRRLADRRRAPRVPEA